MKRFSRLWTHAGRFLPGTACSARVAVVAVLLLACAERGVRADPAASTQRTVATAPATRPVDPAVYTTRLPSADGIGKMYMGREIAHVMGHLAADWLERPERDREEQPRKAIEMMNLRPTDVVADIGAGSGYFSFRIARKVPKGKVLAVDIQPEMLDIIRKTSKDDGVRNVEPILGTIDDPKLPADTVDVALMVDAYHEFDHPREMMEGIVRGLKAGGRVIDIEYRAEDPKVQIKPHHKMTEAQAIKEMQAVGLRHVTTLEDLPQQHFMIFEKPRAEEKAKG